MTEPNHISTAEETAKTVMQFYNKYAGHQIDMSNWSFQPFFTLEDLNDWQLRLVRDRFTKFMVAKMLERCETDDIAVVYESLEYYPFVGKDESTEIGPVFLQKRWNTTEMLEQVFAEFNFSQLAHVKIFAPLYIPQIVGGEITEKLTQENTSYGYPCYVLPKMNVCITPTGIAGNEKALELLTKIRELYQPEVAEFLRIYKDCPVIPHREFCEWLQQRFPHIIRFKELA